MYLPLFILIHMKLFGIPGIQSVVKTLVILPSPLHTIKIAHWVLL